MNTQQQIDLLAEAIAQLHRAVSALTDVVQLDNTDAFKALHQCQHLLGEVAQETDETNTTPSDKPYLIWSHEHRAWWRSSSHGYTRNRAAAGLYTLAQAEEIVASANAYLSDNDIPNECIVPE